MRVQQCLVGSLVEAEALIAVINRVLGYPKRGTQAGGGRHVATPVNWDGTGPTPPGWTRTAAEAVELDDGSYAVTVGHVISELTVPAVRAQLTALERGRLANVQSFDLRVRRKPRDVEGVLLQP